MFSANLSGFKRIPSVSPADWCILSELALLAPVVKIGLKWVSFRKLLAILAPAHAQGTAAAPAHSHAEALCHTARRFFRRYPIRLSCLEQSLILIWLLRRHKVPAFLKIGVSGREEGLFAHAWVEQYGRVLHDSGGPRKDFEAVLSLDGQLRQV